MYPGKTSYHKFSIKVGGLSFQAPLSIGILERGCEGHGGLKASLLHKLAEINK